MRMIPARAARAAVLVAAVSGLAGIAVAAHAAPVRAAARLPAARPVTVPGGISPPVAGVQDQLTARHVVLIGIGGLRWNDVSPATAPTLWRLASSGADGSLVVSGVTQRTCPADGWLTLNGGARAAVRLAPAGPCPPVPSVETGRAGPGPASVPAAARVPAMPGLVSYNKRFHYDPSWGLLGGAPGPGGCALAAGPGAALALAAPDGRVATYLASPASLTGAMIAACRLTVVDLGTIPTGGSRSAALRAADRELAHLITLLPPATRLVVASPGGSAPHLRVAVATGPGFTRGLLTSASTHQRGLVLLTDLTPTILDWLGRKVPPQVVNTPLRALARTSPAAPAAFLASQDTAAQVYRATVTPFYQLVGFGYPALFALIWLAPWGRGEQRARRRRAAARAAGLWAASLPAGTFLASLVPWWQATHPAAVLYSAAAGWAAVIAAGALAGPWRRDPLGPPGAVAAVTLAVIGADLITGSHLALETPFGISLLEAGRFYGLANNAVVTFAAAGILAAAWAGSALLRHGQRGRALAAMAAIAAGTVTVAGWPAFGAKVGGTIAMVPAFAVLLVATAKVRITARRAVLIAVSGLAVVAAFALAAYFLPVAGQTDISGFVGESLHGGAAAILQRKISSNLGSLTANPFVPVIPAVLLLLGVALARPGRARASLLARAFHQIPLLRPALAAIWLAAVLSWFAEDSGVTVPAAALPMVLPLAVVILSSLPERAASGPEPAAGPVAAGEGHTADSPGQPGYL